MVRSIVWSGLSVKPNCMRPVPPRNESGSAVLLQTAEPGGWYPVLGSREVRVRVGSPVAVELPGVADFGDEVQVEVSDDEFLVLVARHVTDELSARVDEV